MWYLSASYLFCVALSYANAVDDDWHIVKRFNLSDMDSVRSEWTIVEHPKGWAKKNELQEYIDSPKTIFVRHGRLVLRAYRKNGEYFSARLQSKETFALGDHAGKRLRVEFTAKIPTQPGSWPALWLRGDVAMYGPSPFGGEIDVMEWVYYLRDNFASAFHWRPGRQRLVRFPYERWKLSSQFITYGVEYSNHISDEYVQFYVRTPNGVMQNNGPKAKRNEWIWDNFPTCQHAYTPEANRCSFLAPFDNRMHLLMNIAVGGHYGNCCGVKKHHYDAFERVRGVEMEIASVVIYAASWY